MATFLTTAPEMGAKTYQTQRREFERALRATFPLFLAATVFRRLGRLILMRDRSGSRLSLLAETRASAATVIPFIFMG